MVWLAKDLTRDDDTSRIHLIHLPTGCQKSSTSEKWTSLDGHSRQNFKSHGTLNQDLACEKVTHVSLCVCSHLGSLVMNYNQIVHNVQSKSAAHVQFEYIRLLCRPFPENVQKRTFFTWVKTPGSVNNMGDHEVFCPHWKGNFGKSYFCSWYRTISAPGPAVPPDLVWCRKISTNNCPYLQQRKLPHFSAKMIADDTILNINWNTSNHFLSHEQIDNWVQVIWHLRALTHFPCRHLAQTNSASVVLARKEDQRQIWATSALFPAEATKKEVANVSFDAKKRERSEGKILSNCTMLAYSEVEWMNDVSQRSSWQQENCALRLELETQETWGKQSVQPWAVLGTLVPDTNLPRTKTAGHTSHMYQLTATLYAFIDFRLRFSGITWKINCHQEIINLMATIQT